MSNLSRFAVAGALASALVGVAAPAHADIKSPSDHPPYTIELEPHLSFFVIDDDDFGLGVRGSFVLIDPGPITTINNTAGISIGLDFVDGNNHCHGRRNDGHRDCHDHDRFDVPVVFQWNFWFHRQWSAFFEPGIVMQFFQDHDDHFDHGDNDDNFDIDPAIYIGGRFNFTDAIALTLRFGTPRSSIGVSFMF